MTDVLSFAVGVVAIAVGVASMVVGARDACRPAGERSEFGDCGPAVAAGGLFVVFLGMVLASLGVGWGVM